MFEEAIRGINRLSLIKILIPGDGFEKQTKTKFYVYYHRFRSISILGKVYYRFMILIIFIFEWQMLAYELLILIQKLCSISLYFGTYELFLQ